MNKVHIKNSKEIELMREAGRLLAKVFAMLDKKVEEGISTMQINDWVERYIVDVLQARPASKGQYDYPYSLNTSLNHVVCHGMPDEQYFLKNGDIVNVDITLEKNGFISDSSKTYMIGNVPAEATSLVESTYQAMFAGIKCVKPGARLGDVGNAIATYAQARGYSVVREYCGHGIGRQMHEAPAVMHFGRVGTGLLLQEGMTFTIEPMINMGSAKTSLNDDGWTVVTQDKKLSAQWEHTILVTPTGYEILTLRDEER
ncbi:MAG: type I methionyl aminopeptidase [Saccharospirillaceae bacterium]|nr:type I methionyl aminopeptidase [Saccharospirillaceae bacterium]